MKIIKSALEVLKFEKSNISGQPCNTAAVTVLVVALEMSTSHDRMIAWNINILLPEILSRHTSASLLNGSIQVTALGPLEGSAHLWLSRLSRSK